MRVLVTGAGGYVGSAVVQALSESGHVPVALVRDDRAALPAGAEVRVGDLLSSASLQAAVSDVDAVCHLAGLTRARESWQHAMRYFSINGTGTVTLLAAMESANVDRLVFASTGAIYGAPELQPINEDFPDALPHPYAASKAAAESAIEWQARAEHVAAIVLRLFNVAGGNDPDPTRIIPRALSVAAGDAPSLDVNGDGTALRDFLHVSDAARAFVDAIDHVPTIGEVRRYNIGSGVGTSVMDVVKGAEEVTGRPVAVVHRQAAAEPHAITCDPSRAAAELGWKPRQSALNAIVADAWACRQRMSGV